MFGRPTRSGACNFEVCHRYVHYVFSDAPNAEDEIEALLAKAAQASPGNPEIAYTTANFRLLQQRPDEAAAAMEEFVRGCKAQSGSQLVSGTLIGP